MSAEALTGGFTDAPVDAARAFRAALNALARPGTVEEISGGAAPAPLSPAAATLLLTLADAETSVFLAGSHDMAPVREWITFHTGAALTGRAEATFAVGTWEALLPLADYPIGIPEYPDRSTTLIVEVPALSPANARLTGPGIKETAEMLLPDPAALKANAALYPLGLDVFLTCGGQLAGLPRTTKIEVL